jgi:hypothetical protein
VMIFSGVLERFPNLKLVSAENEVGCPAAGRPPGRSAGAENS